MDVPVNQNAVAFVTVLPFGKQIIVPTAEAFAVGSGGVGISPNVWIPQFENFVDDLDIG